MFCMFSMWNTYSSWITRNFFSIWGEIFACSPQDDHISKKFCCYVFDFWSTNFDITPLITTDAIEDSRLLIQSFLICFASWIFLAAAVVLNSLPLEAFSHIGLLNEKCISNARYSSTLVPQSFRDWKTLRDCSRQIHLLHGDTSDEILVHYAIVATSNCSGPQPFCNPGSVKWSKKTTVNPGNSKDVDPELQSLSVPAYSGGLHRLGTLQTSGRITNQTETTLTQPQTFANNRISGSPAFLVCSPVKQSRTQCRDLQRFIDSR